MSYTCALNLESERFLSFFLSIFILYQWSTGISAGRGLSESFDPFFPTFTLVILSQKIRMCTGIRECWTWI